VDREPSLRSEMVFGAVFGFGLSALGWTLAFAPPPMDPAAFALIGLAGAAGALRRPALSPHRHGAFLPIAIATLALYGLGAAVAGAALSAAIRLARESLDHQRPRLRRGAFDLGLRSTTTAVGGAAWFLAGGGVGQAPAWALVPAAVAFAITYAVVRAGIVRFGFPPRADGPDTQRRPALAFGRDLAGWTFAVGAGLLLAELYRQDALRVGLLAGPLIYFLFLLGRSRVEHSDRRQRHREQADRIYRAISRALTRARDDDAESTDHLWRVQSLCLAVGEKLGLSRDELDALSSAALLHDVGKIAVPEAILSKPGRLTAKEMECVKVHPAFGAEVLDALSFPAPIRMIVRHHHERWDGRGYPDGLEGEEIPLGARILAVVDCFDAMISHRPFRHALPAAVACRHLHRESGAMFDPVVVDAALDQIEDQAPAPGSGAARNERRMSDRRAPALPAVSVRKGLDSLYAIARATRYPIDFDECCTLVRTHLADLLPHRSLVVFAREPEGRRLTPRFVSGEAADRIRRLRLDASDCISGSAMSHRKIVVGQDHSVTSEVGSPRSDLEELLDDPVIRRLGSCLSAPLVSEGRCVGTLTLYDDDDRRFTEEDRRIVGTVAGHLAHAMVRELEQSCDAGARLTDPLTGLPDSEFLQLEANRRFNDPDREADRREALIGIRVGRLADLAAGWGIDVAERALGQIARRLADACRPAEVLVRLGPDLFAVLMPVEDEGQFIERWNVLQKAVEREPLDLPSQPFCRLQFNLAQVRYPDDGEDIDSLVSELDAKLVALADAPGRVVPFRSSRIA